MNKYIIPLLLMLSFGLLYASDSVISYLNASSNGSNIKVEWRSSDENNVQKYEIERANKNKKFEYISEIDAKGFATSYSYSDDTALKSVEKEGGLQSDNLYSYRIKIITKDKSSTYSNSINVVHSTSGVQRTWGMIKEMFR